MWLVGKSTGLKNIRILISPVTIGYLTSIHSQNMIRVFNLRILHCQVFNAIHGKVSNIHVHGLMHEL